MTEIKWSVLIVDDEANNRQIMRQILKDTYKLSFATDGLRALDKAARDKPDMILLDLIMPGIDGYDTCQRLKANPATACIPVIFVTSMVDVEDESRGFEAGGIDYITKPVSPSIVLHRVAAHIELSRQKRICEETIIRRTKELVESQQTSVFMLGKAGHYNDTDTGSHIWRMASFSVEIAKACGWNADEVDLITYAAAMHDTGKIGIPDRILRKPAKLDTDEWKIIVTHPVIGYGILSESNTPLFKMSADIAHCHHEKWNGSGYPNGLKEKETPESAAIVAIADVFDALTTVRPYKEAWPIDKAFEEIRNGAGSHFAPYLVDCFFDVEAEIRRLKDTWDQKEKTGDTRI
ncbi:response regulator [Candidatus Magnetominusculus xianensis]|uniref:Two-component system response regulator n=1 Tax=Candidatus Magnetominusculus xianensis TaxID=1748249 RepID=A0ABR5SF95_9BACT|nr:HD domain-containing phosphohydrolase [Candidatus Magnetominusculus xianensis]KWT85884.1 two-component system response regulator [Candidatus Magnetominusculus xianensis]MBF0403557.1 response regulator [Nitrospirota bacterium]